MKALICHVWPAELAKAKKQRQQAAKQEAIASGMQLPKAAGKGGKGGKGHGKGSQAREGQAVSRLHLSAMAAASEIDCLVNNCSL